MDFNLSEAPNYLKVFVSWQAIVFMFCFTLVYLIILKPLVPLLLLKLKFGKDVKIIFFPILGFNYWYLKGSQEKGHPYNFIIELARSNPNLKAILTNQLIYPCIMFCQPQLWKPVMQEHQQYKRFDFFPITGLMNKGLVFTNGELWKRQRKTLSHSFTYDQLIDRVPTIKKITQDELSKIVPNTDIDVLELSTKIAGEVIIRTFFAHSFGESIINGKNASLEIQNLINEVTNLYNSPIFTLKFIFFKQNGVKILPTKTERELVHRVDLLRKKALDVIRDRMQQKKTSEDKSQDFLDVYLKEDQVITPELEDEMIQQFITFFFGGTDTTSHLILHMIYFLSLDQKMQEDVRSEVLELSAQGFNSDTLKKYFKLSALINETLRLQVLGEGSFPREVMHDTQINEFHLKKGWYVNQVANFYCRIDKNFHDPETFNIYRWLDNKDQTLNNDPLKFIPFLAFGRNCIGQHLAQIETKIIIAMILSSYRVEPTGRNKRLVQNFLMDFDDNKIARFVPLSTN